MARRWQTVPALTVLAFVGAIALATVLLLLPGICTAGGNSLVDACFMATSATCVTGLAVRDIGSEYSFLGQLVILGAIQVGGIGILTLAKLLLVSRERRMDELSRSYLDQAYGSLPNEGPRSVLRHTIVYTLGCELLGALLLMPAFIPRLGWLPGLWASVFHSVSAFCNAGFALWSDSLAPFSGDLYLNGVIMALIIAGGIGFLTVTDLHRWWLARRRDLQHRLSLHARLVISGSVLLILLGGMAIWTLSLGVDESCGLLQSIFLSVSCRTAGFTTVDLAQISNAGLMVMMMLMFIGGAPGSTAGGVKVSTVAVLVAMLDSRARGKQQVECFHRALPPEQVGKALVTVISMGLMVIFAVTTLEFTEVGGMAHADKRGVFLDHAFEVVSALGTVGLSTGITGELSVAGRLVLVVCMLIGRLGPLLIGASIIGQPQQRRYTYPREPVLVG